jgi:adenylate cyclase class 2
VCGGPKPAASEQAYDIAVIEQEIKLEFDSPEAARRSVHATGARLVVSRRLLDDALFDTADRQLGQRGSALRIRRDGDRGLLTFKGPVQPAAVKTREEIETPVGDAAAAEGLLRALGYQRWFRSQKYREEFDLDGCHVMIDETPIGVFIELEGTPDAIDRAAGALGRSPRDYGLDSYPRLFRRWCDARGVPFGDMLFE